MFGINYNRPGPGVRKDAPPQKPFFRFFSILGRKFFDFIKLNLLFSIPVTIGFVLMCLINSIPGMSGTYLVYLPVVFVSPFVAGLTIVTRNYAREEHAFIFSDFMDCVKHNWKAFLINGTICYVLSFVMSFSLHYYSSMSSQNAIYFFAMIICAAITILLVFAQYYVPVMIVTFDLKITQIYKNALMFSIIGLWRNLLLTVLLSVIIYGIYLMQVTIITAVLGIIIIILLLFSFCMFLINFVVYPLIDKTMIQPYNKNKKEN